MQKTYSEELVEEVDEVVASGRVLLTLQFLQDRGFELGALAPIGEEDDRRNVSDVLGVVQVECLQLLVLQNVLELTVLEEALFDSSQFVQRKVLPEESLATQVDQLTQMLFIADVW
jgi:hypothetical protein